MEQAIETLLPAGRLDGRRAGAMNPASLTRRSWLLAEIYGETAPLGAETPWISND
jgi:hypothetical protein